MRGTIRLAAAALTAVLIAPTGGSAQGFRLRLDGRVQGVSFRGVRLDSVPAGSVVPGPNGGEQTSDGFAVRCVNGDPYCSFLRPGPIHRGGPFTTTADLSLWGLGVSGLSIRGTARLLTDLGDASPWPGTEPALQLLTGQVEYAADHFTAQAGRVQAFNRLGVSGFDGGRVVVRHLLPGLEISGYGGWGLARGVALPVTSPALNPLDDFQPRRRQVIAGAAAAWSDRRVDAQAVYQRELDPRSWDFTSERVGGNAAIRLFPFLSITGGADYDLARQWWGSAEATVGYRSRLVSATAGARRYRPYFDLWTIWGVFTPVPYRAVEGSVSLTPVPRLSLRARGERYWYDQTGADAPLVRTEDRGWRWSAGGRVIATPQLALDGNLTVEFGPGAASRGGDLGVTFTPTPAVTVIASGALLERPLEFRFSEATVKAFGVEVETRPAPMARVAAGFQRYFENRDRPDAAAFDWDQVRLTARVTLLFSSGADQTLPPAVPGRRGSTVP